MKLKAMTRMMTEPVKTPIWLDRNSPTCGTRKIPRAMPCRISATIRTSQTAKALVMTANRVV